MKHTTGSLAFWTAIGGDFMPITGGVDRNGVDQGDGTYVTVLAHPDGRTIALRTRHGDGWQPGRLVAAVIGGPWRNMARPETVTNWRDLRMLLDYQQPGRELPYDLSDPIRQPRALDGRERDILGRILRDIERALREGGDTQQRLLSVIDIDQQEVNRLLEMRVILDARDD